ncbi:hypothetical protein [Rhizobium phage RHph_I40]|uniref:Uncharacterized protein n=1 Tax=Rhizobium phage RHph_I38 TaxID=2509734 RepID=A0A7S5UXA6_9CAUD|nr:hypothetical protein EVC01_024 [Rhizobium phage RHph_I38]QXV73653.1 hypothetical protein [Rhizobium phage RHph_I40]
MQTMSTERYIEMVNAFGIEEAYKQRFRCTGRTFRDIMEIARRVSAGEKLYIRSGKAPLHSDYAVRDVLRQVNCVFNAYGVDITEWASGRLVCKASLGSVCVVSATGDITGLLAEEFKLHDC